jgi:gamma-glutamylputrescine oxidase
MNAPFNHIFWSLNSAPQSKPSTQSIKTDVVIIGGGMAGLHAANSFRKKGLSVVVLEKYYCGAGATGKSSGFITPTSELDIDHFYKVYGAHKTRRIWDFVTDGVELIRDSIKTYSIDCDYLQLDTVILANKERDLTTFNNLHRIRTELGYKSSVYQKNEISTFLGSDNYYGALRYGNTFAINPHAYAQGMKKALLDLGIHIYEDTPVTNINGHTVTTYYGSTVQAEYIVVATDHHIPELGALKKEVYHAQSFITISAPLTDAQMHAIFPSDKIMAWDTDMIYQYFRPTCDNRIVVGGGTYLSMYAGKAHHMGSAYKKLSQYFAKKFPHVSVNFEYIWSGLIGISKDMQPLFGALPQNPNLYYMSAATGLPWAAALGNYCAEHVVDKKNDMEEFLRPDRPYIIGGITQSILRNPLTFALSNFYNLYVRR